MLPEFNLGVHQLLEAKRAAGSMPAAAHGLEFEIRFRSVVLTQEHATRLAKMAALWSGNTDQATQVVFAPGNVMRHVPHFRPTETASYTYSRAKIIKTTGGRSARIVVDADGDIIDADSVIKENILTFTYDRYELRASLNAETPITDASDLAGLSGKPTYVRHRGRYRFVFPGPPTMHLDITHVMAGAGSDDDEHFEVELEIDAAYILSSPAPLDNQTIWRMVYAVKQTLENSYFLAMQEEKLAVRRFLDARASCSWTPVLPRPVNPATDVGIVAQSTYALAAKADGVGAWLVVLPHATECFVYVPDDGSVVKIGVKLGDPVGAAGAVFIGEYITDIYTPGRRPAEYKVFYIFDMLYTTDPSLRSRMSTVERICGRLLYASTPRREDITLVALKKYFFFDTYNVETVEMLSKIVYDMRMEIESRGYATDGIILQPLTSPSMRQPGAIMQPVLKYKFGQDTVDFVVAPVADDASHWAMYLRTDGPADLELRRPGMPTAVRLVRRGSFPVPADGTPPRDALGDVIAPLMVVEFAPDRRTPVRIRWGKTCTRTPKTGGNYDAILDPGDADVPFDAVARMLLARVPTPTKTAELRRYNNMVKRTLIAEFAAPTVVDLCFGRGGDLGKYLGERGVQTVFAFDVHDRSIDIARGRLAQLLARRSGSAAAAAAPVVHMHVHDVTQPLPPPPDGPAPASAGLVTCFFAIHYLLASPARFDAFLDNVRRVLVPGSGRFIITCMDGASIVARGLPIANPVFSIAPAAVAGLPDPSSLFAPGNRIRVHLGSDTVLSGNVDAYSSAYETEESLVFIDSALVPYLRQAGFVVERVQPFEAFEDHALDDSIADANQRDFSFLNRAIVCSLPGRPAAPADPGPGPSDRPLTSLTVPELRKLCRERGLKVTGVKAELVQRLS